MNIHPFIIVLTLIVSVNSRREEIGTREDYKEIEVKNFELDRHESKDENFSEPEDSANSESNLDESPSIKCGSKTESKYSNTISPEDISLLINSSSTTNIQNNCCNQSNNNNSGNDSSEDINNSEDNKSWNNAGSLEDVGSGNLTISTNSPSDSNNNLQGSSQINVSTTSEGDSGNISTSTDASPDIKLPGDNQGVSTSPSESTENENTSTPSDISDTNLPGINKDGDGVATVSPGGSEVGNVATSTSSSSSSSNSNINLPGDSTVSSEKNISGNTSTSVNSPSGTDGSDNSKTSPEGDININTPSTGTSATNGNISGGDNTNSGEVSTVSYERNITKNASYSGASSSTITNLPGGTKDEEGVGTPESNDGESLEISTDSSLGTDINSQENNQNKDGMSAVSPGDVSTSIDTSPEIKLPGDNQGVSTPASESTVNEITSTPSDISDTNLPGINKYGDGVATVSPGGSEVGNVATSTSSSSSSSNSNINLPGDSTVSSDKNFSGNKSTSVSSSSGIDGNDNIKTSPEGDININTPSTGTSATNETNISGGDNTNSVEVSTVSYENNITKNTPFSGTSSSTNTNLPGGNKDGDGIGTVSPESNDGENLKISTDSSLGTDITSPENTQNKDSPGDVNNKNELISTGGNISGNISTSTISSSSTNTKSPGLNEDGSSDNSSNAPTNLPGSKKDKDEVGAVSPVGNDEGNLPTSTKCTDINSTGDNQNGVGSNLPGGNHNKNQSISGDASSNTNVNKTSSEGISGTMSISTNSSSDKNAIQNGSGYNTISPGLDISKNTPASDTSISTDTKIPGDNKNRDEDETIGKPTVKETSTDSSHNSSSENNGDVTVPGGNTSTNKGIGKVDGPVTDGPGVQLSKNHNSTILPKDEMPVINIPDLSRVPFLRWWPKIRKIISKIPVIKMVQKIRLPVDLWNLKIDLNTNVCKAFWQYPIRFIARGCYTDRNLFMGTNTATVKGGQSWKVISIRTDDGYILKLYNIVSSKNIGKQPILLISGTGFKSRSYMDRQQQSIAQYLTRNGYNVYIANLRGTDGNLAHKTLNAKKDRKYWDFNLDTVAQNDVSKFVSYIYNKSLETEQKEKLIILTHSNAAIFPLMYAASQPDAAQKYVKGLIAMAPLVIQTKSLLGKITAIINRTALKVLSKLGTVSLYSEWSRLPNISKWFCTLLPYVCALGYNLIYGISFKLSPEMLMKVTETIPDGTSLQLMDHYSQIIRNGGLVKYNYGAKMNTKVYGKKAPPKYDLSKVIWNVVCLYGNKDRFSNKKDIEKLLSSLGSTKKHALRFPVNSTTGFNHMDYLFTKEPDKFVNRGLDYVIKTYMKDEKNMTTN